jgi:dienelactone hydrolase
MKLMNPSKIAFSGGLVFFALFGLKYPLFAQQIEYETSGVKDNLPVFYKKLAERQVYQLSWLQGEKGDFSIWRNEARAKVMECLLTPPPKVDFNPIVIAEQDRGSYVARKIVFNITGDSRVLAFMLVPKSKGPHPAVLLLHDHGAKFDIGKEKVIEPWDEPAEKMASAKAYVKLCYGGRFYGDELAKRGYVCFATDMLNWSDREGGGYAGQQALASTLFNLGTSFAGLIAHEDLRAAEFLSEQPEVDPKRIAAMGLSVGGFRTWQVAALSEHIAAGVSVCWMSTYKGLMVPGNNQTGGNSAYTMIHPGLSHYLDYPDVASIACPKPMMFCCGNQDDLFPVESIKEAFTKMRKVWESQNAGDNLVTKLYDSPHEYNLMMQNDAFLWLDKVLKNTK